MKKFLIIGGIITLGLFGWFFTTKNQLNNQTKTATEAVEKQQSAKLTAEIQQMNGQLIDVREPSEYLESHADDAINIPLGDILKSDFSKIDNSRPIYLICRTGRRAEEAKLFLEKAGFLNVKNIGGLVDWKDAGNKVCSSSSPTCG